MWRGQQTIGPGNQQTLAFENGPSAGEEEVITAWIPGKMLRQNKDEPSMPAGVPNGLEPRTVGLN
jgi:hypothetical protein